MSSDTAPVTTRNRTYADAETRLKYGAAHVVRLFVPVSLCMASVIFTMTTVNFYARDDGVYLVYTPFHTKTTDATERLFMSIGNALTVLFVVIVMTFILIGLYYFKFYKTIHAWLFMSSSVLLSIFTTMYVQEMLKDFNIAVDYITYGFCLWNFAILGMISIHWKGPLVLQQGYLIVVSALMALTLIKYLPDWTVWTVLAIISIWDLFAVLCPKGPLRMLVETAQERNEPIFPALIYSSMIVFPYVVFGAVESVTESDVPLVQSSSGESSQSATPSTVVRYAPLRHRSNQPPATSTAPHAVASGARAAEAGTPIAVASLSQPTQAASRRSQRETAAVGEEGIKLGLGDFIFYSVLVGKASVYGDWNTTAACYVSILVGLASTLMLLAVFRKALPALPISIFTGLIFNFSTRELITPFMTELSMLQITP